jgi:hypothetical protein
MHGFSRDEPTSLKSNVKGDQPYSIFNDYKYDRSEQVNIIRIWYLNTYVAE